MSSKISASDVSDVHIYSGATDPRKLKLCRSHRLELSDLMENKLDKLVRTKLFQSQFEKFLPSDPDKDVHVNICITENEITVRKINSSGGFGRSKTIDLSEIVGSDNDDDSNVEDVQEAEKINQSILKKASKIYQTHLNESSHEDHSDSPLRKRASHHEYARQRSPSSSIGRNDRHSHSSNFEREHPPSSTRRHSVLHKPNTRSASLPRSLDSHRHANTIGSDLTLHPKKEKNHQPPKQSTHFEERLRNLEQRSSTTPPSSHPSLNTERHSQNISQRPDTTSSLSPASTIPISTESQTLEAPLLKNSLSSQHFDQLIQLSKSLSASDLGGSTYLPGEHKEEFMKLPEDIRYAIYYQTYLLTDPSETLNPWPIGQILFEGTSDSDQAMNTCRAHAIRHFLLHTLATDFANTQGKAPCEELLRRFHQLPEEDKSAVYRQLGHIQISVPVHKGPAYAFAANSKFSATNKERSIAINRVLFDRIAEYHRHHTRELMKITRETFQEAYRKLEQERKKT